MQHRRPFVVFSLPRSRSAWLSVLLGCGHDIATTIDHPEEFSGRLRDAGGGSCETGAAFAFPLIRKLMPEARFAVVRRDPRDVLASLQRLAIRDQQTEVWARAAHLDAIAEQPGVLSVEFDALKRSTACAALYHHCRREQMPPAWWAKLDGLNIQIDMAKRIDFLRLRHGRIEALKAEVRARLADA